MPVVTVETTAMFIVDVPEPGAAIGVGLNVTVTPAGCPVALSATALLKPPETVVAIVELPELPAATLTVLGDEPKVRAGVPAVTLTATSSKYMYT